MQQIIIFSAILAVTLAAPGYLGYNSYVPLGKSTITTSSQSIDHGSTHVLHTPVLATHEVEYHVPLGKTTVTKSNQVVNHGSTTVIHTPVVHAPVVHAPVVHAPVVQTPVVHAQVFHAPTYYTSYSSPLVSYKTGDSAITHQSSTVHETVPVVNSLPLYASYH
ncbi:uncharacterized protein LOC125067437 [Vanessa atalanta]|uniref:uncharacterized protein LOC125067437 n=1 Tax=Vanessa atalanta TaxID=42275 RepID=UPI001FCD4489|nr:uncharacterized protein LOC125067437 [Vanessa atalanta]